MNKKWMAFTIALGLVGTTYGVSAQDSKERKAQVEVYVSQDGPEGMPPSMEMGGDNMVFVATEMSFGGKVVKGAPYSAQAVTESVQTLADGNRIVHKNTAQVYRDSEGRTRRDQTVGAVGPYAAAGDPIQTFFINDPVASANYILDPRSKVARKLPRMVWNWKTEEKPAPGTDKPAPGGEGSSQTRVIKERETQERTFVFNAPAPPPGEGAGVGAGAGASVGVAVRQGGPGLPLPPPEGDGAHFEFFGGSKAETKTEKLETRSIEGVQAEGLRITTTIPVGDIGNEQPIQIINERWYSPELQVVVMTRHSDPRFGEMTYRLTNITRSEPSATLFQVPSDYTLKEGPAGGIRTMRRTKSAPPPPQEN